VRRNLGSGLSDRKSIMTGKAKGTGVLLRLKKPALNTRGQLGVTDSNTKDYK